MSEQAQSGPNSGGDLFDMAKDGTTVPDNSAEPRLIPSKPRPDQLADSGNDLGGSDLAEAADNATDIPRTNRDTAGATVLTGTGDALPAQVDSKRLHSVPGGVTHDPTAKGSTRYTNHIRQTHEQDAGASSGPEVDEIPGEEELSREEVIDRVEGKVEQ